MRDYNKIIQKCITDFKKKYPSRKIYSIGSTGKIFILATYTEPESSDDGFYSYDPITNTVAEYPWLIKADEFKKAMSNIVYKE